MPRLLLATFVFALAWVYAFREGLDVWSALAALIVSAGAVLIARGGSGRRPATRDDRVRRRPTRV